MLKRILSRAKKLIGFKPSKKVLTRKERIDKALKEAGLNDIGITIPTHNLSSVIGLDERHMSEFTHLARNLSSKAKRQDYKKYFPNHNICELILFEGPPGTGKTFLAQAIAGSIANCIFINLDTKLLKNSIYLNSTQINVESHFQRFRVLGDLDEIVVVYLDEADSIFSARSDSQNGIAEDNKATVNRFLSFFDGVGGAPKNLIFITSTNLFGHIDPAAVRAGRLRRYRIDGPIQSSNKHMVHKYLRLQFDNMGFIFDPEYKTKVEVKVASQTDCNHKLMDNAGASARFAKEAVKLLSGLTPVEVKESINLSARRTMAELMSFHNDHQLSGTFNQWKFQNEQMILNKWMIQLRNACEQVTDTGK
jgi:SpoVK/Ycf46/Vps4 family AAA+-type ATPase